MRVRRRVRRSATGRWVVEVRIDATDEHVANVGLVRRGKLIHALTGAPTVDEALRVQERVMRGGARKIVSAVAMREASAA